tara:strand:- start:4376 stop:5038 length:663 start_codon:yes stop_codon:yes gene_type:complete
MFTSLFQLNVQKYWSNDKTPLNLDLLLFAFQRKFPRFKTDEQHDVQEAILCIIDILEQYQPIVKEWFYGKKVQETIWPTGKSLNEEDFSIHLMTSRGSDIGKMLQESTNWNVLEDFVDDEGVKHNAASTRMMFSKLPPVFMLSFDVKNHIKIIHELILDNHTYKLTACAMHVGHQHDGHYVSFARQRNRWFFLNDEFVREQQPPDMGSYYFMVYSLENRP